MLKILRDYFNFCGKRKKNYMLGLLGSVLLAVFELLRIIAVGVVVESLVNDSMNMSVLYKSLGLMFVSIVGCFASRNISIIQQTVGGYMCTADKRIEIGNKLKYMPMGFFSQSRLGSIATVTTSSLETMQDVATRTVMMYVQGLLNTALITLAILIFNWKIGLVTISGIAIFSCVNAIMQHIAKRFASKKARSETTLVGSVLEYAQGIGVVKSYNLHKNANKKVDAAIDENKNLNIGMEIAFVPFHVIQSLILKFTGVGMILVSIALYLNGLMPLVHCIMMLVTSFIVFSQLESSGTYSSLLRLIDQLRGKVQDVLDAPIMDVDGKTIVPKDCSIEASKIDFAYDKRKIIDNATFSIPQKTTTAIIGPSGGGKTTLCNLIARFWDINSGSITIGGRDIRDYNLDSLLSNISMVFQDVYLFNDTIENNIKFGKRDATHEEVVAAAKKACAHDFISKLPQGYNTILDESGASISGGEKQRISIARAMIKDAPIVILDEATANVDPENENLLQTAIEELTKNKTLIMIAHRLKTIESADQILVVDEGKIIQRGTHKELLNQGGLYANFIGMREEAIGWKVS